MVNSNGGGLQLVVQLLYYLMQKKDYLVGSQMDDALARGEDIVVSYPFAEGDVEDFIYRQKQYGIKTMLTRKEC